MSTNGFGPLNLNLLGPFVTVAEVASFTGAARKLRLPRSSISRSVASLEQTLGVTLFNRTTRRVALSTAGAAFYARVGPQLAELQKSLGSLPERDETPSGDLRLTAPTDMGVSVLPEVLSGFSVRYPEINLDVHLSSRLVDLVGEGFDCALADHPSARGLVAGGAPPQRRLPRAVRVAELPGPSRHAANAGGHRRPTSGSPSAGKTRFRRSPNPCVAPASGVTTCSSSTRRCAAASASAWCRPSWPGATSRPAISFASFPASSSAPGALYFVYPKSVNVSKKVIAFRDYLIEYLTTHPISPPAPSR